MGLLPHITIKSFFIVFLSVNLFETIIPIVFLYILFKKRDFIVTDFSVFKIFNTQLHSCLDPWKVIFTVYSVLQYSQITRRYSKWYPDLDEIRQRNDAILYPDENTSKWKVTNFGYYSPPVEKKVKNLMVNFGPQHPAAHGVLRMVLELDGEVRCI